MLNPPGRAWLAIALALALGTALAAIAPAVALDWQPTLAWHEPWRALFGRLLMTRPSRTLSPAEAALILVHGQAAKSP